MQYYKISKLKSVVLAIFLLITQLLCDAQELKTGADQLDILTPKLQGKSVGLLVNHTSVVGKTHLTDTLLSLGINIHKVFSPEHGFKGNKPDGEKITGETSESFQLISLYGDAKKPTVKQLENLDIMIIDMQDVGVRCYTYASTMTWMMETCAEVGIPVIVLDRPNPNGSYVDGPVLNEKYESIVGLHPIPLVHGLTLGELALMINGEGWLRDGLKADLEIISVTGWDHNMPYSLPIAPSPNLPNDLAVSLYPSLVLFEGTVASVGRGTDYPFQVIGHPDFKGGFFGFTPHPNAGSKYPPLDNKLCVGISFIGQEPKYELDISQLINFYRNTEVDEFFLDFIYKLSGTDKLKKQIIGKKSELEIRSSWEQDLAAYKLMREKYLLYP
mgnify:CR=1 FL=1